MVVSECLHHTGSPSAPSLSPASLRKLIKKQIPTKKPDSIDALLEAAATDQPDGKGREFAYSSFFAENRNGDQGEVSVVLFC